VIGWPGIGPDQTGGSLALLTPCVAPLVTDARGESGRRGVPAAVRPRYQTIVDLRLVALYAVMLAYGYAIVLAFEDQTRVALENGDLAFRSPARGQDRPQPLGTRSRVF